MQYLQSEIKVIVKNIWASILDLDIQEFDADVPQINEGRYLTGLVHEDGTWQGVITLAYPSTLAR